MMESERSGSAAATTVLASGALPASAATSLAAGEPGSPARPRTVSGYSLPGQGPSTLISIVTVVAIFVLWWVATHSGWIRDIFLPTP